MRKALLILLTYRCPDLPQSCTLIPKRFGQSPADTMFHPPERAGYISANLVVVDDITTGNDADLRAHSWSKAFHLPPQRWVTITSTLRTPISTTRKDRFKTAILRGNPIGNDRHFGALTRHSFQHDRYNDRQQCAQPDRTLCPGQGVPCCPISFPNRRSVLRAMRDEVARNSHGNSAARQAVISSNRVSRNHDSTAAGWRRNWRRRGACSHNRSRCISRTNASTTVGSHW